MSEDAETFRTELQEDPPVLAAFGDIDIGSCESFRAAMQELAVCASGRPLVVDLGGVGFLDSSGLSVLVGSATAHGPIALRGASPIVRRIIEATGLAELLVVEP